MKSHALQTPNVNVQLVYHRGGFCDYCQGFHYKGWMVEKIDPEKPGKYIQKKQTIVNSLTGETLERKRKTITTFPHREDYPDIFEL